MKAMKRYTLEIFKNCFRRIHLTNSNSTMSRICVMINSKGWKAFSLTLIRKPHPYELGSESCLKLLIDFNFFRGTSDHFSEWCFWSSYFGFRHFPLSMDGDIDMESGLQMKSNGEQSKQRVKCGMPLVGALAKEGQGTALLV